MSVFVLSIEPSSLLGSCITYYPIISQLLRDRTITLTCRGLVFHPMIYVDFLLLYHHLYNIYIYVYIYIYTHCLISSWPFVDRCLSILYHWVCTFAQVTVAVPPCVTPSDYWIVQYQYHIIPHKFINQQGFWTANRAWRLSQYCYLIPMLSKNQSVILPSIIQHSHAFPWDSPSIPMIFPWYPLGYKHSYGKSPPLKM